MNNKRRKNLHGAIALMEQAKQIISDMQTEEEFAFDNLPEPLQGSSTGVNIQINSEVLQDAETELEKVIDDITEIISK